MDYITYGYEQMKKILFVNLKLKEKLKQWDRIAKENHLLITENN
jgi:hypothetical protein